MEALRARDRPPANQGRDQIPVCPLSDCYISQLVLEEVTKVSVRGFLQIATTSWNSKWECWLPDFLWRPVRGGLCNEELEKAVAEIQHDTYHNGAGSLWIEMLVQGQVGRNTGRRAVRVSFSSSGSSRARSSTSRSGQVRNCATPSMQARRLLTSSTRFGRRPPTTARQDPLALPNANGVEAKLPNSRHTQYSEQASNSSSLPNSRFTQIQVDSIPSLRKVKAVTTYE